MTEICTIKVGIVEAATFSQINELTMDIDNHTETMVYASNCLPVHDFEILVYVSVWEERDGSVECPNISGGI